jgi:hypothetical protein
VITREKASVEDVWLEKPKEVYKKRVFEET